MWVVTHLASRAGVAIPSQHFYLLRCLCRFLSLFSSLYIYSIYIYIYVCAGISSAELILFFLYFIPGYLSVAVTSQVMHLLLVIREFYWRKVSALLRSSLYEVACVMQAPATLAVMSQITAA